MTTSTTVAKVLKSFASRYDLGLPVASLCLRNRARVLHPDLPVLAQIEGDLAQLCEVAELADGPALVGPDQIVAATRQVHETKTNHGVVAADLELDGETYDEVREELVARGLHVAAALLPIFAEGAPEPAVVDRVARAADLRGEARAVAAERLAPAHALAAREDACAVMARAPFFGAGPLSGAPGAPPARSAADVRSRLADAEASLALRLYKEAYRHRHRPARLAALAPARARACAASARLFASGAVVAALRRDGYAAAPDAAPLADVAAGRADGRRGGPRRASPAREPALALGARRPRQGRRRAGPRRAAATRPHARRQAPRRRVERRGRRGPAPLGSAGDDGDDGLLLVRAPGASFLAPRRSRTRRAAQVGSGWVTWAPEIAATRDLRSGPTYAVLAAARVLACTVFLLASALVERHGPWPTLLGFLACTTAASGGLAALLARRATTTELRFGAAYCALTFFFNGVWPVLYVVTPAAFPTDARGAGFGAANVGKQLGAVALPLVAGALLHRSLLALGLVLTGGWLLGAAAAAVQARRPAYLARGGEEERADGVDADSPLV